MKKRYLSIIVLLCICCMITGCGVSDDTASETTTIIEESEEVTTGTVEESEEVTTETVGGSKEVTTEAVEEKQDEETSEISDKEEQTEEELSEPEESGQESKTEENYYQAATSLSASEVEQYAISIKNYILNNDWNSLSEEMVYPITISGYVFENSQDFLKMDIDNDIDKDFVAAIESESCQEMFCNWQGISMGSSGQIWIGDIEDENGNCELKIIEINDMFTGN